MANTKNTPENERVGSFSGVVIARERSTSGVVGGGGDQGEVNLPKTSRRACFRGVVGIVVTRKRSYPQKRSRWLIFGGCGW